MIAMARAHVLGDRQAGLSPRPRSRPGPRQNRVGASRLAASGRPILEVSDEARRASGSTNVQAFRNLLDSPATLLLWPEPALKRTPINHASIGDVAVASRQRSGLLL
jgi:hypothetical protein